MKLYVCPDFDARLTIGLDHLLHAKATREVETFGFIGNPDRLRMGLGTGIALSTFDEAKLRADGVHVDTRPYHGSGFVSGPSDVTFSFHQNRLDLKDPRQSSADIFHGWQERVCQTLQDLGADVQIARYRGIARDSACVNLTGRSEIVDANRNKIVASIYRDDGLVFSMGGTVLVGKDWTRIYDYMRQPAAKLRGYALEDTLDMPDLTQTLIGHLALAMPDAEAADFTSDEIRIAEHLAGNFKVL